MREAQSQQMQAARLSVRMQREIKLLQTEPPPGVCAWPSQDHLLTNLEAQIAGPEETVYAKGIFKLQIQVPDRYPFEPPSVRFVTPIYHPNIDNGGRICLDILNLPPKGAWRPSLNIATVLASIGLLLTEPNPDDGLMGDISAEYKHNRPTFDKRARLWTQKYAVQIESQNNPLPRKTSSLGGSLQIGQGSSETIGTPGQMEETLKEAATEFPNQANIEVELKDKDHGKPSKSIASLSKRLSLSREPLVQPTKSSSSEVIVMEAKEQFHNNNINFEPAQKTVVEDAQELAVKSVLGEKLCDNVRTNDSASQMHKAFKGPGRGEGKDHCEDKENLQPGCWNAKNPPPSLLASKGLESDPGTRLSMNGMKRTKKTEKVVLRNDTSVDSNQSYTSLVNQGNKKHDELVNPDPLKLKTHKFPISRSCQPEKENLEENIEGSLNVGTVEETPTIIVSDSESDEEPVRVRLRLSLSQRTSIGKRKATCMG